MAARGRHDWFEREEFIGQISDIRVQNLQVEREMVQKRTFTRWMNLHLEKCDPPIEVHDLFQDIQDGQILMALLEELSGCKLLQGFKKTSHRIFRLNNIAKVLTFLEERNVKLVSIDASDVADGNSSIILGLIWNIILFFQIKELTGNIRSQFPSTSSLSSIPTSSDSDTSSSTPSEERQAPSTAARDHGRAIKRLLQWVQKRTRKYGVAAQDFGKSWSSGLAFLAVIKSIDPSLVDMRKSLLRSSRENLEDAFRIAHYSLGIRRLLDPEDVMISSPDEQSIMTYVSQFLEHFPGIEEPEEPCQPIERSVSMGRLNFREADAELMKNGAHRSHVRERSYVFRKDCVQPLPKIFISSVSEDRGVMSPKFTPRGTRSWSSVDFLAESTPEEETSANVARESEEPAGETFARSPRLSYTRSPSGSLVTESVSVESVIGDSAIGSPDSWVESDLGMMPERFCESRSDSSLCDSGTAWDVNVLPASPEDANALGDERLTSSMADRASGKQVIHELYADEGIYSLSSLESNQERIQTCSEKKEEVEKKEKANHLNLSQDLARTRDSGQEEADNKREENSGRQVFIKREPCLVTFFDTEQLTSSGVEPAETNQSQPDSNSKLPTLEHFDERGEEDVVGERTYRETECLQEAVGLSGLPHEHEGHVNAGTEGLRERINSEECKVDTNPAERDVASQTRQASRTNANIPQILIVIEPPDQDQEREWNPERLGRSVDEDEGRSSERGVQETDIDDISAPNRHETSRDDEGNSTNGFKDKLSGTIAVDETDDTQNIRMDPINFQSNHKSESVRYESSGAVRDVDSFYSDFDRSSPTDDLGGDLVEPMDLFYPDKEEPMFTEPDDETESWPSVLSVSALQPAPASKLAEPELFGNGADRAAPERHHVSAAIVESQQGVHEPSERQDESSSPVERTGGLRGADGPAGGSDEQQSPVSARENTQPVRSDTKSSSRRDEIQIPTVLRHRKVADFTESTDNRNTAAVTNSKAKGNMSDFWCMETSEVYLLLLLWLLLYCLWVLPQIDLKSLPSLLLNLDH